jgi:hypothetical protein
VLNTEDVRMQICRGDPSKAAGRFKKIRPAMPQPF